MSDRPLTALQENAAKLLVEGNTQADAYRKAGYNTDNSTDKSVHELASRLFSDIKVSSRVKELQELAQKRHEVTLDSLTQEYNEAKQKAYELDQISSAVSAINGKAKIHGFDKTIIGGESKLVVKIVDMSGKCNNDST